MAGVIDADEKCTSMSCVGRKSHTGAICTLGFYFPGLGPGLGLGREYGRGQGRVHHLLCFGRGVAAGEFLRERSIIAWSIYASTEGHTILGRRDGRVRTMCFAFTQLTFLKNLKRDEVFSTFGLSLQ